MKTYDQLLHLKDSIRQRMEGTPFYPFIGPKDQGELKAFLAKAASFEKLDVSKDDVLSNPETVRNILDQLPESEGYEIYVKEVDSKEEGFIGTWSEYVKKYDFDTASFTE